MENTKKAATKHSSVILHTQDFQQQSKRGKACKKKKGGGINREIETKKKKRSPVCREEVGCNATENAVCVNSNTNKKKRQREEGCVQTPVKKGASEKPKRTFSLQTHNSHAELAIKAAAPHATLLSILVTLAVLITSSTVTQPCAGGGETSSKAIQLPVVVAANFFLY
jgi:hypothetical protein